MKLVLGIILAATLSAQGVTYERIVNALHEQQNWLTYFGDYGAMRYRDLKQITTSNVKDLRLEWMFQTGQTGAFQTVPLVVDGVMYISAANGQAFALDARSGRQLWMYRHTFPSSEKIAQQPNRGMAILGDRVFMVTTDAHLIALEARTGRQLWRASTRSVALRVARLCLPPARSWPGTRRAPSTAFGS